MSDKDWNRLPSWLPRKFKLTGLTPEQAAQRANISRTIMYEYLAGAKRPGDQVALRIARVLGVRVEEIMAQYTHKKTGRPRGSVGTRSVTARRS